MAGMFQSLIGRVSKLRPELLELFDHSVADSSSSSSSSSSIRFPILDDLEELCMKMTRIQGLVYNVEKRVTRDAVVNLWLEKLEDVAYDTEDVVGDVEYELLRYKQVDEDRGIKRKLEVGDPLVALSCPLLHDSSFQQQITGNIRTINAMLDDFFKDGFMLKLHEEGDLGEIESIDSPRRPFFHATSVLLASGSVCDGRGDWGRKDDQRNVVDMLLSEDHDGDNVRVVSIVGADGIGKTTLAQLVFNDGKVATHFETRLWVCCASVDPFDAVKLTRSILRQLLGTCFEHQELTCLQQILREELCGKVFLLVLDDVWNESQERWDALWVSLMGGAKGSRVLITTRDESVSMASRASNNLYRLGFLPDNACWSLFSQQAFSRWNIGDNSDLVPFAREIVRKCQGLPLTVKMLAGLVFSEFTLGRWMDVLKSDLWEPQHGGDRILPGLMLSYHHLPPLVKLCFTSCSVFPKDYKFDRDKLVYLWMALRYMMPIVGKTMEEAGQECFDDLVQRSFFQHSSDGHFQMHNLIHDLALSIRGRECSRLEEDGRLSNTLRKARHLWFEDKAAQEATLLSSTDSFPPYLRTCYLIRDSWAFPDAGCALSVVACMDKVFQYTKHLRVLYLYGWEVETLPDSLGDLKHLCYLSICRMVKLTRLPETLGKLLNLQTLEVLDAFELEELPSSLKDLVSLRHLIVELPRYSYSLRMMPRGIGRLTQLQTLRRFVVGEGICAAQIHELGTLRNLRGELTISIRSLRNNIINKGLAILRTNGLRSLVLEFSEDLDTGGDRSQLASLRQTEGFIQMVRPHSDIKELLIDGYMGRNFPTWMTNHPGLQSIRLNGCGNCRRLPALGRLPSLKHLDVRFMDELMTVDREFYGYASPSQIFFPLLKQLRFYCLPKCEELWFGGQSIEAFPNLDLLEIEDCQKLRNISLRRLPSLRELHIAKCDKLTEVELQPQDMHSNLRTVRLEFCPKLNFPWPHQWPPLSLQRFEFTGSPLLEEWARRHLGD